jgi:hypothetical protein
MRSCFEAYGDVFWTLKSRQPKTPTNETFICGRVWWVRVDFIGGSVSVDLGWIRVLGEFCEFVVDFGRILVGFFTSILVGLFGPRFRA